MEHSSKSCDSKCNPHVYAVGMRSCANIDSETWNSPYMLFFLPSVIWHHHRLLCPKTSCGQASICGSLLCSKGRCADWGADIGIPPVFAFTRSFSPPIFFFFTIMSGSGGFSAMTCDLLRLQSFLLNLLIRFSLSSLGGRSSTLAPDEALRSNSGSRMDLPTRKVKSQQIPEW